jgi:hypothetical protein
LFVAIVLLAVAKLIALQRAEVIAQLANRIAESDSADATSALRQLAAMPHPPVAVLVLATTSANRDVAAEAKLCLSKLLRRAQRQIEAGRRLRSVSRQLAELAESLDARKLKFSSADYPWLASTTHKVLRLANHVHTRHAPLVAAHCDAVLSRVEAELVSPTPVAAYQSNTMEGSNSEAAISADRSGQLDLSHDLPVVAAQLPEAASNRASFPAVAGLVEPPGSVEASAEISANELIGNPWQQGWSHPLFRMMPAQPIHDPPTGQHELPPAPPPVQDKPIEEHSAPEPPLADVASRELLSRWLRAEGSDVFPLEQELTERGFGRLSERLVEQLFSPNLEDRLTLMDDVLTEPGVDARPWLMLLSEESDADVRLLAVTIMATSNDAMLVEKAWQVSIRDQDSRIARLAGRLRERRANTPR